MANADRELVPENDIQFAVHYAMPNQVEDVAMSANTLWLLGERIVDKWRVAE